MATNADTPFTAVLGDRRGSEIERHRPLTETAWRKHHLLVKHRREGAGRNVLAKARAERDDAVLAACASASRRRSSRGGSLRKSGFR
jgi:hypothetical protein